MNEVISHERIEKRIHELRGKKVMLDADLAELYEVATRALNQAVTTNISGQSGSIVSISSSLQAIQQGCFRETPLGFREEIQSTLNNPSSSIMLRGSRGLTGGLAGNHGPPREAAAAATVRSVASKRRGGLLAFRRQRADAHRAVAHAASRSPLPPRVGSASPALKLAISLLRIRRGTYR